MSTALISILIVIAFLFLLFTGLPIVFCMFGISLLFNLIIFGPQSLYVAFVALHGVMRQDVYLAVPLFVLMASFLEYSGIGHDLYDTMHKWMAGLRGGLAMGTVLICSLIDAMSGLGATATVTMGLLALPEMLDRGYDKDIAIGCIPAGGALGPLIPPSVIMIVLGGLWGISVGKLFIAGFVPGFAITFLYCIYIGVRCFLKPELGPSCPPEERGTWKERIIGLYRVILPLIIVLLIMGGIYTGAFTPTEAAGIGAIATFIVICARRRLTWENLKKMLYSTMKINAMVLWLLIGGTSFSVLINSLGISEILASFLYKLELSNIIVVWITMVVVLIMGCFIDGISILMICSPVFLQIVRTLKLDPLWFALIFTIAIVTGYITPPFGMNLFYMKGLVPKNITMRDIYRSIIPFCLIMIIGLALAIHIPSMVTWLPSKMK